MYLSSKMRLGFAILIELQARAGHEIESEVGLSKNVNPTSLSIS